MLKYKLNIHTKKDEVIEVKYDSIYLSKDGSYLTGITSTSYGLSSENEIILVSEDTQICNLQATDVICGGFVLYNQEYDIQDYGDTIGILYNDGYHYCVNKNFEPYFRNEENNKVSQEIDSYVQNPSITINNVRYEIGKYEDGEVIWNEKIIIPTKYWVFDGQITINDIVYDVINDEKNILVNENNFYPYIILNEDNLNDSDRILYVMDWEYSKRQHKTIFSIYPKSRMLLNVKTASCIKNYRYFDDVDENGDIVRYTEDDEDFFEKLSESKQTLQIGLKRCEKSNMIDLFVLNDNIYSLSFNSIIQVKSLNNLKRILGQKNKDGNSIIFKYYNKEYTCNKTSIKKYLVVNNVEYLIYESSKSKFIIFEHMVLEIIDGVEEGNKEYATMKISSHHSTNEKFEIKSYFHLKINEKEYKVLETDKEGIYEVILDSFPTFQLKIINMFNQNILRCIPFNDNDLSELFFAIAVNPMDFIFEIKQRLYHNDITFPSIYGEITNISSVIKMFLNRTSFIVPIKLESDNALNLQKDFIVTNNYINDIKTNAINRIVDMEKDVYYPAYLEKKKSKEYLNLCHQIQIDLHFRTRNLEDWTINEDMKIENYEGRYPSNWNIFDYYRFPIDKTLSKSFKPVLSLNDDMQYYLPSDLLYFLNFSDEDVFFQKQKIGKSFLRLSFYDSPNPNNQSLLHSSTIFMSETDLFNKYINSDKVLSSYVTLKERGSVKESNGKERGIDYKIDNNNQVNRISVSTEPCEDNKKTNLTFNENKRLSSSFIIKNRNECVDSSEGFYLYLFKEYSSWTHERTIYMRVQFNHAGYGRTINFMMLYHKDKNGNKSMINWSSKFNFDKYKEGCPLTELYEHLYIEIKVKYDLDNKRFCYYLPEWMVEKNNNKKIMRLSLFEIKIKDES